MALRIYALYLKMIFAFWDNFKMKISERWLRELVDPAFSTAQLCELLTMAGLEIDEVAAASHEFSGVVIGQITALAPHPNADKLRICTVNLADDKEIILVSAAKNIEINMRVPVALVGAKLSNGTLITTATLRGVVSNGMLCSAADLGLAEASAGVMVLPLAAPLGQNVWEYLKLADNILTVAITPNRGDCLSRLGLALEVAALTHTPAKIPEISITPAEINAAKKIHIAQPEECGRYVGRCIKNISTKAATPLWLQECLRRSGIRVISPVVDVMNYVMLELGQPMHAFDLEKIAGDITVRFAKEDESLALLDGQTVKLATDTLIISDEKNPLAIAGVMGGLDSAVTAETKDIFLESAYFDAAASTRNCRQYHLSSESSYRFERGVDPALTANAIHRATELLLTIVGGEAGPITEILFEKNLPSTKIISLSFYKVTELLGVKIPTDEIKAILTRSGFSFVEEPVGELQVTVPARRFDIKIAADLIEEIARLYGYNNIPMLVPHAELTMPTISEKQISLATIRNYFCDRDYHEVISYSFVDKKLQELINPAVQAKELLNPINSEMAVMRTMLWPGLLNILLMNQNRQQAQIRLFETGLRFIPTDEYLRQELVLSGLINGKNIAEQWGEPSRQVDFFDLKKDLENIFAQANLTANIQFKPTQHPALHLGQAAAIYRDEQEIGLCGTLHPEIALQLGVLGKVILFEILVNELNPVAIRQFKEISKFPSVRRDISILIKQAITSKQLCELIRQVGGNLLQNVQVFDVYTGKNLAHDIKSIALSLTWQHFSRTLVDEEIADLMVQVVDALEKNFAAGLRS
jgi:phenylalanyl-tRNA synthetase beta chain